MSTLKANTIVAADGTSPVTLTKQSAAKLFALYDMRGTTLGADTAGQTFNASSFTDNGSASLSTSLTSSMSDAEFPAITTAHFDGSGDIYTRFAGSGNHTSSSFETNSQYANGSVDATGNFYHLAVFGDLA